MIKSVTAWWIEKRLLPPWVIAWRLLWFVPMQLARLTFVTVVLVAFGPAAACGLWRDTW